MLLSTPLLDNRTTKSRFLWRSSSQWLKLYMSKDSWIVFKSVNRKNVNSNREMREMHKFLVACTRLYKPLCRSVGRSLIGLVCLFVPIQNKIRCISRLWNPIQHAKPRDGLWQPSGQHVHYGRIQRALRYILVRSQVDAQQFQDSFGQNGWPQFISSGSRK